MIKISLIIPVYNSEDGLSDTLNSLLNQKQFDLEEVEIIVVDNNSTDNTYSKAEEYSTRFKNFQLLRQPKQGSYAARNLGIANAKADIFCFVDADVEIEQLFLLKVLAHHRETNFDYAGVNVKMNLSSRSMASYYDALKAFHVGNTISKGGYSPTLTLITTRRSIEIVGKFDERMESGADVVFGKLCRNAGLRQEYLSDIEVIHPTRKTFKNLISKSKRVARGFAFHMKYYPDLFDHERKYFKTIKYYLPNNPIRFYRDSKTRGLNISFFRCFLLTFFHIPLAFSQRMEFYKVLKGNQ